MPAKDAPRAGRPALTRERIVEEALELLDRDGTGFSMRGLGDAVGVEAMSLYHYFPNKDALLDALVEHVIDRAAADLTGTTWQQTIRGYAEALRTTLLRHPGIARFALGRPAVTPGALVTIEGVLEQLTDAGFPLAHALHTVNIVAVFTLAHVVSEVDTRDESASAKEAIGAVADRAPLLMRAVASGQGTDDEERFRFAIEVMIDGLQASLERHGTSPLP